MPEIPQKPWSVGLDQLFTQTMSSEKGLSTGNVENRQKTFGTNELKNHNHHKAIKVFLSQFKSPLVIILIFAALIAFFIGEKIDGVVILGIVVLSSVFGFFQEFSAERAVEDLLKFVTHKTKVLRDGVWVEVDSRQLVLGDVVQLRVGDRVPADLRLFEVEGLSINESSLTGESLPVEKEVKTLSSDLTQPQEQKNLVFGSTYVVSGSGMGFVVAAGENSYVGKTAKLLNEEQPKTDFEKEIQRFSSLLFKVIIALTLFVFFVNAYLGKGIFPSFLFAIALAVGITPELLPAVITITLSHGARKMAKKNVIVRRLIAVEDFGNIDTLCTDKTGTLTEGDLVLADYLNAEGRQDRRVLDLSLVCSSGFVSFGKLTASQVDKALWEGLDEERLRQELSSFELIKENEFDFNQRMNSVLVKEDGKEKAFIKGAWENVFESCSEILVGKRKTSFDQAKKKELAENITGFESEGKRVLALASKELSKDKNASKKDFCFEGIVFFNDPVKEDAAKALETFRNLGIRIKIISGDSASVVTYVAEKVGWEKIDEKLITGDELANLSDEELAQKAEDYSLFARVTPEQKYKIIASLNRDGHTVAFLGDGINDAPALRAADVGIAVNTGADVAKEAADIVLLEKNLLVLASGIEEGRKIFGNITKYILNTISANYGNMFTVAVSSVILRFIPLLPTQILLTNFLSDIPLLAIATDNVDKKFIKKPRHWDISLIGKFMIYFGIISSFFDLALIIPLIFIWQLVPDTFRTAWFIESTLSEILVTFAIRTRLPFFKSKPSNSLLSLSVTVGILILILPLIEIGKNVFKFTYLPWTVSLWIIVVLVGYFFAVENLKHFFFKKFDEN